MARLSLHHSSSPCSPSACRSSTWHGARCRAPCAIVPECCFRGPGTRPGHGPRSGPGQSCYTTVCTTTTTTSTCSAVVVAVPVLPLLLLLLLLYHYHNYNDTSSEYYGSGGRTVRDGHADKSDLRGLDVEASERACWSRCVQDP